MLIKVSGCGKKLNREITEAAEFFGKILLHGTTYKYIQLDIDMHKKYDVLGDCTDEDDVKYPRFFTINLRLPKPGDSGSDTDPIRTLAHEMVHLKQHATGELRSGVVHAVKTKGKSILKVSSKWMGEIWYPGTKQCAYFDSPWEVEAYGREVGLYHRWIKRND